LIVALARSPDTPNQPTFDTADSNRFQNVLLWTVGTSQDIAVTGYKVYTDNGLPGNSFLIYDGTDNTEVMRYEHKDLTTGTPY
jgi:hypothetical protein